MIDDRRPVLDMTPAGEFRAPARPNWTARVLGLAIAVAVIAGAVSVAAFALWLALLLIPVVLIAVLVAVGVIRFKIWQAQRRRGYVRDVQRY